MALTARGARINRSIVRAVLTMHATVYSRATSGPDKGKFTVVERSDLPCLLTSASSNAATSVADRAALAAQRTFQYDATYDLAETGVQVEVDAFPGQRWNVQPGTADPAYAPRIGIVGKSVLVVRQG
jgi:hypothetical protein